MSSLTESSVARTLDRLRDRALVRPALRAGAAVIADNTNMADSRPFIDLVRAQGSGFAATPLYDGSMEIAVYEGGGDVV